MPKFRQSQGEVVNQTNDASKLIIISSERSTGCIYPPTTGVFCGGIYAPGTTAIIKGNGLQIIGAIIANCIKVSGLVTIRYDAKILIVVFCIPRQIVCGKKWWGPPPPYEPGKYPIITDFKVVPDPEEPLYEGEERTYQIVLLGQQGQEIPLDVFPYYAPPSLFDVSPENSALVEVVGMHHIPPGYELLCLGPGETIIHLGVYVLTNPPGLEFLTKPVPNNQKTKPKIEFLDSLQKEKVETTILKVAKWQEAFDIATTPPFAVTVKTNFIILDPDHFYVRVTDLAKKGAGKVPVKLSTIDCPDPAYNDNPTPLELEETPANSGIFESRPLMLMSDNVDDDYPVGGISDDTKNDPTHIIALGGGKAKAEYESISAIAITEFKTVSVKIVILTLDGYPVIPFADVQNDWKLVVERFAQVGVKVNWIDITITPPPPGVELADGFTIRENKADTILSNEAKSLISNLGTVPDTKDIHVFYVNDIRDGTNGKIAFGTAVADYYYDDTEDPYTYNIVLGADRGLFDPAHELGHLLTNWGYETNIAKTNLMYESAYGQNTVTTMKRFDTSQEELIMKDPHVK